MENEKKQLSMSKERDEFEEINKSFEQFITELQKQPVSKNKIVELSDKFHKAIKLQSKQFIDSKNNNGIQNTKIAINLNRLKIEPKFQVKSDLRYKLWRWAEGFALSSVGILFITIGFILIITPASAEFEIATIFYFNEYDGFTVMDMFALVIIFIGIFFFIRAFIEKDKQLD